MGCPTGRHQTQLAFGMCNHQCEREDVEECAKCVACQQG